MLSPLACSREALARLFQNAASTLEIIFLFSYILSILLSKISSSIFSSASRQQPYEYEDEYEDEDIMFRQEFGDTTQELAVETEEGQEVESFRYDSDGSYGGGGSMMGERDHLVADVVDGGETLMFISSTGIDHDVNRNSFDDGYSDFDEEAEYFEVGCVDRQREECREIRTEEEIRVRLKKKVEEDVVIVEDITGREDCYLDDDDKDDSEHEEPLVRRKPAIIVDSSKRDVFTTENNINKSQDTRASNYGTTTVVTEPEIKQESEIIELPKEETGENTLIHEPPKTDNRKMKAVVINTHETNYHGQHMITEINEEKEELFSESCTNGSTSKSSSDWRSSFTCTNNDPFTSSSSRSCAKWESYTVFQKYDEEMMFLDRISAQKLQDTESLKYFHVPPKSISYKIIHTVLPKTQSDHLNIYSNTAYFELESTYVAQICLAWEALSWDYDTFKRKQDRLKRPPYNNNKKDDHDEEDQGCPAHIAQQFQQFQVVLQRYIENEPYERGRRPELYARMRRVAPKLLQVPEYHDYDNERLKEVESSRVPTSSFQSILEESIWTFMNFLKADRENRCQAMFEAFLRRSRGGRGSNIDPNVLKIMKKENKKKKLKLKQMQRASRRICFGKVKLTKGEEMEIRMGLIDLKVVSRVLRMGGGGGGHLLTQEQVRWCESKMAKVVLADGRLKRDSSSPLFFPAH